MIYKRKNIDIEAIQWNGSNLEEIKNLTHFAKEINGNLKVKLTNGMSVYVEINDYVVKDDTEVYVLSPEHFNKLFEVIKIKNKIKENLENEKC